MGDGGGDGRRGGRGGGVERHVEERHTAGAVVEDEGDVEHAKHRREKRGG